MDYQWFVIGTALNGLILLLLTINVSRIRMKHQISLGDGGNKSLNKAIRTHANGVEQVPMFLLLVLSLEFLKVSSDLLGAIVMLFTLSRLFHAVGMLGGPFICRRVGAGVTYLAQMAVVALLVKHVLVMLFS